MVLDDVYGIDGLGDYSLSAMPRRAAPRRVAARPRAALRRPAAVVTKSAAAAPRQSRPLMKYNKLILVGLGVAVAFLAYKALRTSK